jgi:exopolyphosphatase/guanosine-5'-triphosphate,3'-diphosphate pyrophosphatase
LKIFRLLPLLFVLIASAPAMAKHCQEVRMGLDIGSGSTKIMVAKVDFCKSKILEVLYKDFRSVPYNEDLEKSTDGKLSPAIVEKGLSTLKEMVTKANTFKPKRNYGVATSVFRKAANGVDVIKTMARKLNLRLEVISQETEARLAYYSVQGLLDEKTIDPKKVVIWDIGGGSMQIYTMTDSKKPVMYLGDLASVTFKNMIIEVLQSRPLDDAASPNPIGDKREQVIALARSYARLHVPMELKQLLKDRVMIGVGGVHGFSIKNQLQLKEPVYTLEDLDKAGRVQVAKSDKDLTGDYRTTDVSNLLLVQGFMEGLELKEVKILSANLVQGALLK